MQVYALYQIYGAKGPHKQIHPLQVLPLCKSALNFGADREEEALSHSSRSAGCRSPASSGVALGGGLAYEEQVQRLLEDLNSEQFATRVLVNTTLSV